MAEQIKSKKRVADYGEVFTSEREINNMLDLVKHEADRIESTFLEPACGTGNFIIEIYKRKLNLVEKKYKKSQTDFEKWSFVATSSIYGVDIMEDNIHECRSRLLEIFVIQYKKLYKEKYKEDFVHVIAYILSKNILVGDALTMLQNNGQPLKFPEWKFTGLGSFVKRRDYVYSELIPDESSFSMNKSIENRSYFIPEPIEDFPSVYYMKVFEYDKK